jgi:uncharacterized protein YchJ
MSAAIHQDSTLSSPRFSPFDGLSPAQAQVVAALAQGGAVTAAAAGLHCTTIHYWMRNEPKFAAPVTQARQDYAYAVAEQLHQLSAQALVHLRALPDPPDEPATARNAPCPCGSGLKYKRCCGRNAPPRLSVVSSLTVPPN